MTNLNEPNVVVARPLRPLFPEDGEVFVFRFSEGAVLAAFDPSTGRGSAVLVTESGAAELIRGLAFVSGAVQLKVIGRGKAASAIEAALAERGAARPTRHELGEGHHEVYFYSRTGRARVSRNQRIKVLIVDDSKTIRDLLSGILKTDPSLEVVAMADGPGQVEELIARHRPDVITLDIHMPGMDGVTLLKKYLPRYPVPTVMISSISLEEGPMVLSALEAGAVEYIQKPSFNQLKELGPIIVDKIKAAAAAKVAPKSGTKPGLSHGAMRLPAGLMDPSRLIAIGSSTGGTEALRVLLAGLPDKIPPIVIVQHIPPIFSKAFAMRMDDLFAFDVKEAEDGDEVRPNLVLIAPGGKQMELKRAGKALRAVITDAPPVNRHKPSVDVLFDSVVEQVGGSALGVILTGMGGDGARGLVKMRQAGSHTIAQDEASSVVFGMPKEAIRLGGAESVMPLDEIAGKLVALAQPRAAKRSAS